jgi:serine/threonine protein kinase
VSLPKAARCGASCSVEQSLWLCAVDAQAMSHVNIIELHDAFEDSTHVHLVRVCRCARRRRLRARRMSFYSLFCCCTCAAVQVFEPCSGGELFEPISNRKFTFSEFHAAVVLRKLLHAVRHIHRSGCVHRDIKPENILLVEHGVDSELKVTTASEAMPCGCVGINTPDVLYKGVAVYVVY